MFIIRELGIQPYTKIWQQMMDFTIHRTENTVDEIWLLEHEPVFTQGQAGKPEHILNETQIPIVQTDRGGQVTYHGPGQLVAYFLLDCKKNQIGIKQLVTGIEDLTIDILKGFNIRAQKKCGAPGVYVGERKIASLGLRIKNHCSYHGLAINVAMDLGPFKQINPCGFSKLEMTQIQEFVPDITTQQISDSLIKSLMNYIREDCLFKQETICKLSTS